MFFFFLLRVVVRATMRCYNVHVYHGGLDITRIHYYGHLLIYDTDSNDRHTL
jgi:hypothetical protein